MNNTQKFITLLRNQDFEYGISCPADDFVEELWNKSASDTKCWLYNLFISTDSDIQVGILRVIARIEFSKMPLIGLDIAAHALTSEHIEVRECGIRAIEGWDNLRGYKLLESIEIKPDWLNTYKNSVLKRKIKND